MIGPVDGATPPLISQLKQTLRHSTPIGGFFYHNARPGSAARSAPEPLCFKTDFLFPFYAEITSFSEKSDMVGDVSADVAMATSDIVSGESGESAADKGDGKLSLRMKLVTPVEEGSSERFSLQSKNSSLFFFFSSLGPTCWYPWRRCIIISDSLSFSFFSQSQHCQKRMDPSSRLPLFPRL